MDKKFINTIKKIVKAKGLVKDTDYRIISMEYSKGMRSEVIDDNVLKTSIISLVKNIEFGKGSLEIYIKDVLKSKCIDFDYLYETDDITMENFYVVNPKFINFTNLSLFGLGAVQLKSGEFAIYNTAWKIEDESMDEIEFIDEMVAIKMYLQYSYPNLFDFVELEKVMCDKGSFEYLITCTNKKSIIRKLEQIFRNKKGKVIKFSKNANVV